jgi:hypothetical protein
MRRAQRSIADYEGEGSQRELAIDPAHLTEPYLVRCEPGAFGRSVRPQAM